MKKIERKDFLKLGGGAILGGATGMVLSGAPFMSFQWLVEWSQDQYIPIKGIEKYVDSINNACSNKCKVSVRKISDRAVQISSEEGLCPSCMNSLQLLYHPERLFKPLKKVGKKGSGQFMSVSWEEALKDISGQLNKAGKGDIAGITKGRSVSSDLLEKIIYESGNSEFYYEPDADTLSSAVFDGKLSYNFDNADFILSFGAKLFEGWGNASDMKKLLANKSKKKIVQIDCNCTRTASMSNEWVNIKAGTEAVLAFGIARYLITEKNLTLKDEGFADFSQLIINQYKPGVVFKVTGVKKEKVNELAEALLKADNPVVVAGRGGSVVTSSSAELVAVNTLNRLIKSKNVSVEKYTGLNSFELKTKSNGLDEFISKGSFKSIIINNANPVYSSVYGDKLSEKLKDSFVVTISSFINDTATYSDYILPDLMFLEPEAVKSNTKALNNIDIILKIAKGITAVKDKFSWTDSSELKEQGGSYKAVKIDFNYKMDKLKNDFADFKNMSGNKLSLVPLELQYVGDGEGLKFPYVNKLLDGETYSSGKLWVQLNSSTAVKYGISRGDKISIKAGNNKIGPVKVLITDIIAPDTIAIPLGFGQIANTKFAKNKGVNPKKIMTDKIDPLTGAANWFVTEVEIS